MEAFLKVKGCLLLPKCWFLPPTSGSCIRIGETWAEKKCIHLSSHKISVFHRGNGQISPLTGFVNSYWGLRGGGVVGNVRMPCELEQAVTSLCHGRGRPALQRGLESAGDTGGDGWVTMGQPQSHARAQMARLRPQHQSAAMKLDLNRQSIRDFFPSPLEHIPWPS